MILSSQNQLQECISLNKEGQFVAVYKALTLRSVYQPIFNKLNHVIGVEALVRIDESRLPVRPDVFFNAKSVPLNDKINVERLSRAIHIRNFSNSKYRSLKLFLNVLPSAGEFFALEDIRIDLLSQRLTALNIDKDQVVMEVVELESGNEFHLQAAMARLAHKGFHIAIDDFGVQASNRHRVELIKPSIIKIDRSLLLAFMQGETEPLLSGIKLARRVQAKVVIEGIETQSQYDAMRELDIDYYQGYFLGMPESLDCISLATSA
ncbi:EAL domain-containing protein [Vibrio renipiscarius]|uniref:Diguanylate phosphodiesterase n=1 Tax=Vibrio renipiscarius TaxID=1461322 RepID=A0A0C2K0H8_9VIBR|nr:EAL domain-containing protein [Vibrio renipiscarius]KII75428.1 diguanylate phosphodiesterase [Vibrio renipiscarius]KII78881.1 diguanylate phosphodiesterase [Vibrio renipiscarius]